MLVKRSQKQLSEPVAGAREAGLSWQALGVSRQAAFKRFGGAVPHSEGGIGMTDLLERTRGGHSSPAPFDIPDRFEHSGGAGGRLTGAPGGITGASVVSPAAVQEGAGPVMRESGGV